MLENLYNISEAGLKQILVKIKECKSSQIDNILKEIFINWIKLSDHVYIYENLFKGVFYTLLNEYLYNNYEWWIYDLTESIKETRRWIEWDTDMIILICYNIQNKEELIDYSSRFPELLNWIYFDLLNENVKVFIEETKWGEKYTEILKQRKNQVLEAENKKKEDAEKIKNELSENIEYLKNNCTLISSKLIFQYRNHKLYFTEDQINFTKKHIIKILEASNCNLEDITYEHRKTWETTWVSITHPFISDWTIFNCIKSWLEGFWWSRRNELYKRKIG